MIPTADEIASGHKIVVVQPYLPKYDIPLLEELARDPGIQLIVLADLRAKTVLNYYDPRRDAFQALHLERKLVGPFSIRPGLFKHLANLRPDTVILGGDPREISQLAAAVWCRLKGVPVAMWGMFHRIGPRRIYTEIYMWVIGEVADMLLSYGEKGRREQIRRGTREEKIVVLSTAIDEKPILKIRNTITDAMVEEFIAREGLDGKRILLHVVRLTAIKNPEFMVKAFAILAHQRDDVLLVWIGGGVLEDRVRQLSAQLGVLDRMRFLGPIYDEEVLALWFKAASVFVMSTCIGLSIHHAMCYGVPVVTDNSETTQSSEFEILQNEINGLVYTAGDADDFVRKICRILDDDELRKRLSVNAMHRVEVDYTFARKCSNFSIAFQRLLAMRRSRRTYLIRSKL